MRNLRQRIAYWIAPWLKPQSITVDFDTWMGDVSAWQNREPITRSTGPGSGASY